MKRLIGVLAFLCGAAFASVANAAIYPSALVDSQYVSSFGSGDVTGAPDNGGLWLGSDSDPPTNLGYITVRFDTALGNGAGADLQIVDVTSSSNETFEVLVSSDGVSFTDLGEYSATNNLVDFDGLFLGAVSFVKLVNTASCCSVDIDTIIGFYEAATSEVPVPPAALLFLSGAAAVGWRKKRKKAA